MRLFTSLLIFAACAKGPTPTGTTCPEPDPLTGTTTATWANFGQAFMAKYCINCHDSELTINERNGAPLFHDFNTEEATLEVANHTDEQAGWGPDAHNNFMPGAGTNGRCPSTLGGSLDEACPEPTGSERTELAQWLACDTLRTHCWGSDGEDHPGECGSGDVVIDAGIDAPGSGSGSDAGSGSDGSDSGSD